MIGNIAGNFPHRKISRTRAIVTCPNDNELNGADMAKGSLGIIGQTRRCITECDCLFDKKYRQWDVLRWTNHRDV